MASKAARLPTIIIFLLSVLAILASVANAAPVLLERQQVAVVSQSITNAISTTSTSLVAPTALVNSVTLDGLVSPTRSFLIAVPSATAPAVGNFAILKSATPTDITSLVPSSSSTSITIPSRPPSLSASSSLSMLGTITPPMPTGAPTQIMKEIGVLTPTLSVVRPTTSSTSGASQSVGEGLKKQQMLSPMVVILLAVGALFWFVVISFLFVKLVFPARGSTTAKDLESGSTGGATLVSADSLKMILAFAGGNAAQFGGDSQKLWPWALFQATTPPMKCDEESVERVIIPDICVTPPMEDIVSGAARIHTYAIV